jgi:integrase/recombinase XerD
MATIKVIIRPEKTKKNGEVPLYIRMTRNRKSKYISLRQSLLPRFWDEDKQRVRKSHPNAARLNAFIAEKRAEIEALSLDVEQGRTQISRKGMRDVFEGGSGESFLDFAEEVLRKLEREGRFGTYRNYRTSVKGFRLWLKTCLNKSDISFRELDLAIARRYREYLENERGNQPATVFLRFAALKSILSHAREAGVIEQSFKPLAGMTVRQPKSRKVIPTQDEMAAIEAFELKPGSNMAHVRNLYVFCANMAGLRFSDAITLRWSQVAGERLRWQTQKDGQAAIGLHAGKSPVHHRPIPKRGSARQRFHFSFPAGTGKCGWQNPQPALQPQKHQLQCHPAAHLQTGRIGTDFQFSHFAAFLRHRFTPTRHAGGSAATPTHPFQPQPDHAIRPNRQ